MSPTESITYLGFVVQVAANVAVAFYVLTLWRQHRLRFLLVFGVSALLGIFTGVADQLLVKTPMADDVYVRLWCAIGLLRIIDLVLYAGSVVLMVRHLQSNFNSRDASAAPPAAPPPPPPPTRTPR